MCGCENHRNESAPCTCNCPEHADVDGPERPETAKQIMREERRLLQQYKDEEAKQVARAALPDHPPQIIETEK